MMTKEVTKTIVTVAKMEMVEGTPTIVNLPDEVILGNVSMEKAQKLVNKKYDCPVTILEIDTDSLTYQMPVEKFIELAEIKPDKEAEETEEEIEHTTLN